MQTINAGFRVQLKLGGRYNNEALTLRNVTEIHWQYPSLLTVKSVAFESDIHATGLTYPVSEVVEFEATLEGEIADSF